MENKYYTPTIEDIHVGYECEWQDIGGNCEWIKAKIDEYIIFEILSIDLPEGQLKTLYLTKEQIEAEGWIIRTDKIHKGFQFAFEKGDYFGVCLQNGKLDIHLKDALKDDYTEHTSNTRLYFGNCPSINEFRTICKLLNIK